MPVKIEPKMSKGPGHIGNWSKTRLLSDPENTEARAMTIDKESVNIKRHSDSKSQQKEKTIKIRMLKDIKAAPDHIHVKELKAGKEYEIPESMAKGFFKKNLAIKI